MRAYGLEVVVSKQEDGLWRAEVPALPGCFVDASTVKEALSDIQECIAMTLDLYEEEGWAFPPEVERGGQVPFRAVLPVVIDEFKFRRLPGKGRARNPPA